MRRGKQAKTATETARSGLGREHKPRMPNGRSGINKEADGRWHAYVFLGIHPVSKRRMKKHIVGRTKSEVATKLIDAEKNIEEVRLQVGNRKLTVEAWLKHWSSLNHKNRAPNTAKQYEWAVKQYLIPNLGDLEMAKMKTDDIEKRFDTMRSVRGHLATVATKEKVLTTLTTALGVAVHRRHLIHNPARTVVLERHLEKETVPLSKEEAGTFLRYVVDKPDAARWFIGLNLGLRQGEVLGLKWVDIDLQAGTLDLQRQWARKSYRHGCPDPSGCDYMPEKCPGRIENPRERDLKPGVGRRTISLDDRVVDTLRKWKVRQAQEQLKAARWEGGGWVFTTKAGTPIDHRNDYRRFQKLLKEAGIGSRQIHAMRHTFASLSVTAGVDSRITKQITGWKSDAMLMRYTHIQNESTKQAATAILNEMLGAAQAAGAPIPAAAGDSVEDLKAKFLAFVEGL